MNYVFCLFKLVKNGSAVKNDSAVKNGATIVASYTYDPWGRPLTSTGTVTNPYRYAGYRYDTPTGLYCLLNRYYSPDSCRFITRDLLAGDTKQPATMNHYAYCLGDPVNKVDPSGLSPLFDAEGCESIAAYLWYDLNVLLMASLVIGEYLTDGLDTPLTVKEAGILRDAGETLAAVEEIESAGVEAGESIAAESATIADPAAQRVSLRASTKAAIKNAAPKTADGDFVDPNTGQAIPGDGPFHYGHKPGLEWRTTQQIAREQGWSREQVIEYENNPSHYQIEDPASNMSHRYEAPR